MISIDNFVYKLPLLGSRFRRMRTAEALVRLINPGHFYSPVPSHEDIIQEQRYIEIVKDDSLPGIPLNTQSQIELCGTLLRTWHQWKKHMAVRDNQSPCRYTHDNGLFHETDSAILQAMIFHVLPRNIIEIGGGHSTHAILDAIELLPANRPSLTVIEPYAERLKVGLKAGDLESIRLIELPFQKTDIPIHDTISSGDMLFIDSSHVSKCASDVNRLIFETLPQLPPGVLIHVHDIFFPFRYPQNWLERGQYWNEAYLLRAFLMFNSQFRIQLWCDYLRSVSPDSINGFSDGGGEDIAASFWMQSQPPLQIG